MHHNVRDVSGASLGRFTRADPIVLVGEEERLAARRREDRRCNFVRTQPEETRRWLRRAEASPPPRNEKEGWGHEARRQPMSGDVSGSTCSERHVSRSRVRPQPHASISGKSTPVLIPTNEYRWTVNESKNKNPFSPPTRIALVWYHNRGGYNNNL